MQLLISLITPTTEYIIINTYVYTHTHMYIYTHIYIHTCVLTYVCMLYVRVCAYIYTYTYMYIYIYMRTHVCAKDAMIKLSLHHGLFLLNSQLQQKLSFLLYIQIVIVWSLNLHRMTCRMLQIFF